MDTNVQSQQLSVAPDLIACLPEIPLFIQPYLARIKPPSSSCVSLEYLDQNLNTELLLQETARYLKSLNQELEGHLSIYEQTTKDLLREINSRTQEVNKYIISKKKLDQEIQSLKMENMRVTQENQSLLLKNEGILEKNEELLEKIEIGVRERQREEEERKLELYRMKRELDQKSIQNEKLKQQNENLKIDVQQLKDIVNQTEAKYQHLIAQETKLKSWQGINDLSSHEHLSNPEPGSLPGPSENKILTVEPALNTPTIQSVPIPVEPTSSPSPVSLDTNLGKLSQDLRSTKNEIKILEEKLQKVQKDRDGAVWHLSHLHQGSQDLGVFFERLSGRVWGGEVPSTGLWTPHSRPLQLPEWKQGGPEILKYDMDEEGGVGSGAKRGLLNGNWGHVSKKQKK